MPELPVAGILPELQRTFRTHQTAVLAAPPGSGKTTLVPGAMLACCRKIIMLEPRRLAARAAAARIAELLGSPLGELAGYRVRGESRTGKNTRIEVVTEGILTRMLQQDPGLDGVDLLIFDEFHERHIEGDLALAFALDTAGALRPDLKILVMSATLDGAAVAHLLGDAPVLQCSGTLFPITEHWGSGWGDMREAGPRAARMVRQILTEESGDILVFLPGTREIREAAELLTPLESEKLHVETLYGSMDFRRQRAAVQPGPPGTRRIVLATNIAESSLTIEGVRVVVDSGLERVSRFDPASGMERLVTIRASQSSMRQRAGRAGRLGPGAVYRFCTENEFQHAEAFRIPEILSADLTGVVLELACWGAAPEQLKWLDPPPGPAWNEGRALLTGLGALDAEGHLTKRGRAIHEYPAHPRIGTMMLAAADRHQIPLAAELAALVTERDILPDNPSADLRDRLDLWRRRPQAYPALNAARDALLQAAGCRYREQDDAEAGRLIAAAYPDRIARRRGQGCRLAGGRGAVTLPGDPLGSTSEWLAVANLDGAGSSARIRLALPYSETWLREDFPTETRETVRLEEDRVTAFREEFFGAVVLSSVRLESPTADQAAAPLAEAIRQRGENILGLDADAAGWLVRLRFARRTGSWPDPAEHWEDLVLLAGARSVEELRRADWKSLFRQWLGYGGSQKLDTEFPERFTAPTGSRLRIDYSGEKPVLAVKVQELYGQKVHPILAGGKLPLVLSLLSPAGRPIQVTGDLPGFWAGSWELVRKEMRGRYPKHVWPENPADAAPTTRAKPRRQ